MCSGAFGQGTEAPPAATSIDKAVEDVVERVRADLARRQIKKLAIARVYYNGSAVAPAAKFVQRKIVGRTIDTAGDDLVVMERQDMRLLAGENALQWMIGGTTEPGFSESQALLTGEILWDKGLGQALLSLRVIDTKTGLLICAPSRVVMLSRDLQERFGVATTEPPGSDIFRIDPRVDIAAAALAVKLAAAKTRLSFAEPSAVAEKYRFSYRVLSAFLADHLTSKRLEVLEREFLFQIADEQAASQKDLNTVLLGNAVLQVDPDESTDPDSPTFFVRAVGRQDGRIIAQSAFHLTRAATPLRTSGTPTARMGTPGADEALAEVVAAHRRTSEIRTSDSLVFTESFRLSAEMRVDEQTQLLLKSRQRHSGAVWTMAERSPWAHVSLNHRVSSYPERFDGPAALDVLLQKFVSIEHEQPVLAVKADLLAAVMVDLVSSDDRRNIFPGPLTVLAARIASQYTLRKLPGLSETEWMWILYEGDGFLSQWHRSMHPLRRNEQTIAIDPIRGRCMVRFGRSESTFYIRDGNDGKDRPTAVFDYVVKVDWAGKYPAELTITLDLSPMRERMRRVTKEDQEQGQLQFYN